jgi:uroporphyrinogen-III decarboxylase
MPSAKSPAELYEEREKRLRDALELRVPDRVPVVLTTNYFPARYVGEGLTVADSYYNPEKWKKATLKTISELDPDIHAAQAGGSGPALAALGPKLFKWAGGGLGPDVMHQYYEGEPLKAEEYDLFLSDPGDFTLRYYLPRVWKEMEPLAKLPSLQSLWGGSTLPNRAGAFNNPDVKKAFAALAKAGEEQEKHSKVMGSIEEDLAQLGFPSLAQGNAAAPFDAVSDHLRGMAGTMLDMFRYPEKVQRACDLILSRSISSGMMALQSKRGNPKRVGSALHRGSDGFMTLKHFETFYWATFKKLVMATTGAGLVHVPFYEGNWEQRLQYLRELPKAKTIARFALTDMVKAKEALKGHTCVMGGIPHGLLQVGSPSEVEDLVKNLIKTCGKDGGLIITTSTAVTHEARPENVKAMVAAVKKYGKY